MQTLTCDEFRQLIQDQGVPLEQAKFVCPRCKTEQCAQDLIDAGVGESIDDVERYLAFSCVGRWTREKGCDWTLGGLFQIHELEVMHEGKAHPRFRPVNLAPEVEPERANA